MDNSAELIIQFYNQLTLIQFVFSIPLLFLHSPSLLLSSSPSLLTSPQFLLFPIYLFSPSPLSFLPSLVLFFLPLTLFTSCASFPPVIPSPFLPPLPFSLKLSRNLHSF